MLLFYLFWLHEKNHSLVPSGKKNLSHFYLAFSLIKFIKKKKIETKT